VLGQYAMKQLLLFTQILAFGFKRIKTKKKERGQGRREKGNKNRKLTFEEAYPMICCLEERCSGTKFGIGIGNMPQ
jgi:hypothetical protein